MSQIKPQTHNILRKKTSDVEAGYVEQADAKIARIINTIEKRKSFDERACKIAQDDRYIRNYTFPELIEWSPNENKLWSVDRYFPHASGGPLVIEEPSLQHQIDLCERKRTLIEKLGIRYIMLLTNKTEADDFEELEKCNGRLLQTQSLT